MDAARFRHVPSIALRCWSEFSDSQEVTWRKSREGYLLIYTPNGSVRIVFLASVGGRNEVPLTAKNLDAAEIVFMTCGLATERAAELRAELERNKVVSMETSIDEAVAGKFRSSSPRI